MTAQDLSTYAAILLSLVCSYFPGIKDAFDLLLPTYKRLVMLILLTITTAAIFGLACWGVWHTPVSITCDATGAAALVKALIAAIIANQAAFLLSPRVRRTSIYKSILSDPNALRVK